MPAKSVRMTADPHDVSPSYIVDVVLKVLDFGS